MSEAFEALDVLEPFETFEPFEARHGERQRRGQTTVRIPKFRGAPWKPLSAHRVQASIGIAAGVLVGRFASAPASD
ncbi:hypothetical protein [Burkholderia sp. MSMB1498]|uniref:hypothetical protein n=1 Tax=Burkholderia sp. MSMB1498 TaxID=1637842 RepID=UPI000756129E|nr:hypothetical protein [Burkholderia sp. MSMB1498]KVK91541.1 hypothetical protein WS91_25560 [Burkholderia sp. MSMB1498]